MIRFFRNLRLDSISFLAGFVAATLFWLLLRILRPSLLRGWQRAKNWAQSARQGLLTNIDQRYRVDTLKYVQGIHLAASLFSLDEVLIPPRLLAPPVLVDPEMPPPYEDTVSTTISYAPDWSELAAVYEAKTLDVFDVLEGGSNLAITGRMGNGKTTALAYIASKIARQDPDIGKFDQYIPVFLHAAELNLPPDEEDTSLNVLLRAVSARASALTLPRLSELIRTSFDNGQAVLLLDGLDELTSDSMEEIIDFLKSLLEEYPDIQVVAAADVYQIDKLPSLGFAAVPLNIWGRKNQAKFINQWGKLWSQHIIPDADNGNFIDPILLNGWLLNLENAATPFDLTLKVWSAYAGDALGPNDVDGIESYIKRVSVGLPQSRVVLERIASGLMNSKDSGFSENQFSDWLRAESPDEEISEEEEMIDEHTDQKETSTKETVKKSIIYQVITDLTQNGALRLLSNKKYYFVHPNITCYLAESLPEHPEPEGFNSSPSWPLNDRSRYYHSAKHRNGKDIHQMLIDRSDPLKRELLDAGLWLRHLPNDLVERKLILQALTVDLKEEQLPMGLRNRVLAALATSGDPGVSTLFRHLLNAPQNTVRQLAVIGCGYLRDSKSVGDLIKKINDLPNVATAACLALVNIGTKPALEAVATALIQGDERIRRAAAEAFASHPSEGYSVLKEGSTVEDLLTRRAVIYGLRRVNQPWAVEILEELQIEDAQWVVKDAAAQAVKELNAPDPAVPNPQPPLEDLPWLIAFAGDRDSGLSAGAPAKEMLIKVLEEGNDDEKLAALSQICRRGEANIFPAVYYLLNDENPELKEAAFHTIWHIATTGNPIPSLEGLDLRS
jgi:HEAT repeat protein